MALKHCMEQKCSAVPTSAAEKAIRSRYSGLYIAAIFDILNEQAKSNDGAKEVGHQLIRILFKLQCAIR